ncbi:MAG: hypothetical protein JO279_02185 [Verrucomicrobia bacterium]|nr:hypothetical protein [Verrucomicrobiota bacterium]
MIKKIKVSSKCVMLLFSVSVASQSKTELILSALAESLTMFIFFYIDHHRTRTFQEEYLEFLKKSTM